MILHSRLAPCLGHVEFEEQQVNKIETGSLCLAEIFFMAETHMNRLQDRCSLGVQDMTSET